MAFLPLLVCVALALTCLPAAAGQEVARIPIIDAPQGTAGIGGGFRLESNPYRGDHTGLDLVPLYLFEGKYLFAHGTSLGVHAFRSKHFTADVFVQYRFMRLDPDIDEFYEGLEKREQTTDAGIALTFQGQWGKIRVDWLTDVLDRHNGQEAELAYRYRWDRGAWSFSPFVNFSWQDSDLTDYYYGVRPNEAQPGRPAYSPGSAFNFGYGLNTSYQVSERILAFGNFGIEEFDRVIEDSPLVEESGTIAFYFGAAFMFGNMKKATTPHAERENEWSWRTNFGYQASGNIVGENNHGDFSKSEFVDTNILGLTLSKLLNDGPRVDFYGRLAIYRHLERGLQDNFFSVAPYVMAMGTGYGRWSGRPVFRWGFGFGFSYAQEIPIVEQIKQERRGRNSNQFLNYLEMTLDFPLSRVTKAKALKNCYVGLTLVHRSGIFNTSDILGNVEGGSDWITAHLECLR